MGGGWGVGRLKVLSLFPSQILISVLTIIKDVFRIAPTPMEAMPVFVEQDMNCHLISRPALVRYV